MMFWQVAGVMCGKSGSSTTNELTAEVTHKYGGIRLCSSRMPRGEGGRLRGARGGEIVLEDSGFELVCA